MKMKNLLKSIIVIGLSLMLVSTFTTYVFADDDPDWEEAAVVNNNNVSSENNTLNTVQENNTTNTNNTNSTNTTNTNTNSTSTSGTNASNTNNNVSSNALAYTGSGSTNGIMTVALVVGVVVSVYSYKKFNEYKNI